MVKQDVEGDWNVKQGWEYESYVTRVEQGLTHRAGDKMYWENVSEQKYSEAHLETRGQNWSLQVASVYYLYKENNKR